MHRWNESANAIRNIVCIQIMITKQTRLFLTGYEARSSIVRTVCDCRLSCVLKTDYMGRSCRTHLKMHYDNTPMKFTLDCNSCENDSF